MPSSASPAAPAVADAALPSPLAASFLLQARAEPGVMPRVLELFAKRGLVPQKWHSAAAGPALTIEVQIGGLGDEVTDYIARCMRQVVGVEAVLTSRTRLPS